MIQMFFFISIDIKIIKKYLHEITEIFLKSLHNYFLKSS